MQITRDQLKRVVQALDGEDRDVRVSYSGRGMMGRECVGFTTHQPLIVVGVALCEVLDDEGDAWEMARAARTDNMGHDTIVYFPSVTLDEVDRDEFFDHE